MGKKQSSEFSFAPSEHPERWDGIIRPYTPEDVERLRVLDNRPALAFKGSERLWGDMTTESFVRTYGALTGGMAEEMMHAGLQAIYVSGWQVAADMNSDRLTYPDQSLYSVDSVPKLVDRINQAFYRAAQVAKLNGEEIDPYLPIVADAESGFGGVPHAYQLMRRLIKAGAAGAHLEDQLASAKKCGHMGGKVLIPMKEHIDKLVAMRLAADVMETPTIVIARTDANSARLLNNDIDERDTPFIDHEKGRTDEGFYHYKGGLEASIARGLAFAPYADLLWMETSQADKDEAKAFAQAIHEKFPGKMLAYNCSPSFNWMENFKKKYWDDKKIDIQNEYRIAKEIESFQDELGEMGYKFQFITLAGWHSLKLSTYNLAKEYGEQGMPPYVALQEQEFKEAPHIATHQQAAGTGVFDEIQNIVTGGKSSTTALKDSTEDHQFTKE